MRSTNEEYTERLDGWMDGWMDGMDGMDGYTKKREDNYLRGSRCRPVSPGWGESSAGGEREGQRGRERERHRG